MASRPSLTETAGGPQADIDIPIRFRSQQPQRPDLVQTLLHEPVAGTGERCRGDIARLAGALGQ